MVSDFRVAVERLTEEKPRGPRGEDTSAKQKRRETAARNKKNKRRRDAAASMKAYKASLPKHKPDAKVKSWVAFRRWVAGNLPVAAHPHIKKMAQILKDVDYEGPELFSGSSSPPFSAWEDDFNHDGQYQDSWEGRIGEWWVDDGRDVIYDWVLNMHPGLAPNDLRVALGYPSNPDLDDDEEGYYGNDYE